MTVYVGDVKSQVVALSDALNQVEDLDEASVSQLTAMRIVARVTVETIEARVNELDPQLLGDDLAVGGLSAGIFALDGISAINALSASLEQMNGLLDCGAYAGRIEVNLRQATGEAI